MKFWLTLGVLSLCSAFAIAAETVDLKVGDKAPTFEALDDTGKPWKSSEHVGKKVVVVYFYPADMTGGCTKQACGFRDKLGELSKKGIEVVGVSGDTVKSHQLFKQEHDLTFPLLADTEGKVAAAFGVPVTPGEKKVNAKFKTGKEEVLIRNVTTKRWTFIIDKDGKIAHKNTEVAAAEDPQAVLDAVEKLQK
ncbi:MAG TPA: peroxiredoxin [Planctomycetaceae bacterium]|jgi:peroxiredoxin Q/BCP|nr:peroxiredoxin [Planctomycetaceae bacterium]